MFSLWREAADHPEGGWRSPLFVSFWALHTVHAHAGELVCVVPSSPTSWRLRGEAGPRIYVTNNIPPATPSLSPGLQAAVLSTFLRILITSENSEPGVQG